MNTNHRFLSVATVVAFAIPSLAVQAVYSRIADAPPGGLVAGALGVLWLAWTVLRESRAVGNVRRVQCCRI
ncbi:hypothetical protein GALL_136120 [mine drainage metagenome]|uniref:Uncharacterized protein n=1 Tax=mine drainage metagenome TaxID=410659 RepID=A0A1J5SS07_9ZZZZ